MGHENFFSGRGSVGVQLVVALRPKRLCAHGRLLVPLLKTQDIGMTPNGSDR